MKKILILCSVFLTGCCYNELNVLLEEPDFQAEKKVLVYQDNSSSSGTKLLRAALHKKGIKVLKYGSTVTTSIKERSSSDRLAKDTTIQTYNKIDGSPYVIDLTYDIDPTVVCLTGENTRLYRNIAVEITNLETNEVVYSIEGMGLDGECGYCSGKIFDQFAEEIAKFWNESENTDN